jgi:ribonuclease P/MRP protein subunit POP5
MVRFKNRHILVEFLQPHLLDPSFAHPVSLPAVDPLDELDDFDDEDVLPRIPEIPFLLPLPSIDGSESRLKLGDEGGGSVYRAVRGVIQEVYGDEGWGRMASSFKGESEVY